MSETSKSLSVRSRSLKKIYRVENFCANVLKLHRSPRNPENSSLLKQKNTSSKYGQEEDFSVIQAVATLKVTDVKRSRV